MEARCVWSHMTTPSTAREAGKCSFGGAGVEAVIWTANNVITREWETVHWELMISYRCDMSSGTLRERRWEGTRGLCFYFLLCLLSFLLYEAVLVLEQRLVTAVGHHSGVTPFNLVKLLLYFHIMFLNLDASSGSFIPSFNTHFPNVYQVPGVLLGSVGSTTKRVTILWELKLCTLSVVIRGKSNTSRMSSHLYITCVSVCAGERHRIYSKMPFFRINAENSKFQDWPEIQALALSSSVLTGGKLGRTS